jgi:CheY-like chemotaxis protein
LVGDDLAVARILILEPQPEIRDLVARVVTRLGHDAVETAESPSEIDAVVVEPESMRGLAVAQQFRLLDPDLPIVCTSIAPQTPATRELGPVAYLVKPFALDALQGVLEQALATPSVRGA